jgi:hypothetical protein
MAFQPVWMRKVISTKCDYGNKDICMTLQMVNTGIAIGQDLEMLANEKTLQTLIAGFLILCLLF